MNYVCRDLDWEKIPCEGAPTENEYFGCSHYLKMEVYFLMYVNGEEKKFSSVGLGKNTGKI